jgi:hypothetical protein
LILLLAEPLRQHRPRIGLLIAACATRIDILKPYAAVITPTSLRSLAPFAPGLITHRPAA